MPSLPFAVVPTALGTITTGNELASNPAAHLGEFSDIGMTWETSNNTNCWVRCNFGAAKPIDYVSIIHANALVGTTIRVRLGDTQAEVDGTADYDSTAVAFINPSITRDDGLYSSHLDLPSLQTKQWMRIDIGGHTGAFEASKLIAGQKVTPANYYSAGFQYGLEDLGDITIGRWGVGEETPGLIFRTLDFTLGWLSESDFETKLRPLTEKLGKRRPALWCFDPAANAYRQNRTYYGWVRNNAPTSGGVANTRYEQQFQILSMV